MHALKNHFYDKYCQIVMKGYGFGVWLVYDQSLLGTQHLGHFTVACFMAKDDATRMYQEILGLTQNKKITIHLESQSQLYAKNMYAKDENDICSWGYNGTCSTWLQLKRVCEKYECNFSNTIHTSIQYAVDAALLKPVDLCGCNNGVTAVECTVHVVNICGDNPMNWHVI